MPFKQFKMISHKTFAAVLAVWLSGLVFLLCCETINGKAADAEFCPLAKMSEHCDKAAKDQDSEVVTNQTNEQEMDCCAFIPVFFDKPRTIETNPQIAPVASVAVVEEPKLVYVQAIFAPTSSYQSTVRLRNDTFLKNCSFRI